MSYSQILAENRRFEPTPLLFGASVGGDPLEFRRDLWHQSLAMVWRCLHDTTFSRWYNTGV